MFEGIRAIIANFASKSYGSESDNFNALTNKLRSDLIDSDVSFAVADKISSKMRDIIKLNQQNYDILSALKQEILTIVGHSSKEIHFRNDKMTVIMLCGTQGVGKTSTCAKLCKQVALEKPNARVAVFSLDFKRSAAQEQLSLLCRQNNIDFISINSLEYKASNISGYAKYLYSIAEKSGYSVLVVDTQGILDTNIFDMQRLCDIKQVVRPDEVLCVIDSTSGQSVIDIVKKFDKTIGLSGVVLTKTDSDAKGGIALNIMDAIKVPIKYLTFGEKIYDIEKFIPERIANRILNIKDLNGIKEYIKKNRSNPVEKSDLVQKVMNGVFDLNDLYNELLHISKSGFIAGINNFLPVKINTSKIKALNKEMSIILSMTKKERQFPDLIDELRKKRIAKGSGTSVTDVDFVINRFNRIKQALIA